MSEIILPEHRVTRRLDPEQMLNELIERKVQEILADKEAASLYPIFPGNGKLLTDALKRRLTVSEQQRGTRYYERYGCRICADRERGHASLGLCRNCYAREVQRDKTLRAEFERPEIAPAMLPVDRVAVAKAALPGPLPGPEYIDGLPEFVDRKATARAALKHHQPEFRTPRIHMKGGKNLPLTSDQIDRLIAAADTPLECAIITLVYSTGCDLTELSRMRIEDVSWDKQLTIRIVESREPERIAPLNSQAVDALREFLGERTSGFIFEKPHTRRDWHQGCVQRRRSGIWECWFLIWHEKVMNEDRKPDFRTRVKILGCTGAPPFKPRVYESHLNGKPEWAISWREPRATGKGLRRSAWLGHMDTTTREEAEAKRDQIYAEKIANLSPKWKVITEEVAHSRADEFVKSNLRRIPKPRGPTSIPDRIMAAIIKAVAARAGLGEINAHMLRRAFNPNALTDGAE